MKRTILFLTIGLSLLLFSAACSMALAPAWQINLGSAIEGAPTVYNGNIYLGDDAGKLYCLDLATGATNWTTDCTRFQDSDDASTLRIHTRPSIYGETAGQESLFVSTSNGYVICVNLDGSLKWVQHPTLDENGTPALYNGSVYFGNSGQIHKLNAATGDLGPTSRAFGSLIKSSVSIPKTDLIWFGSNNGWIYCLSTDMKTRRAAIQTGPQPVYSSPYVDIRPGMDAAKLYIGSSNNDFRCLSATGFAPIWGPVRVGGAIESSPWLDPFSDRVIVGCNDGKIYVFNATNGAIVGTFQAGGELKASPVLVDGVIYIGGEDNTLYAVTMADMTLKWSYAATAGVTGPAIGEVGEHMFLVSGCKDGKVVGFKIK